MFSEDEVSEIFDEMFPNHELKPISLEDVNELFMELKQNMQKKKHTFRGKEFTVIEEVNPQNFGYCLN